MRLLCLLFAHRRSRKKAMFDYDEQQWRSVCRFCGTALERDRGGEWRELQT